jgi:hypothetical protein
MALASALKVVSVLRQRRVLRLRRLLGAEGVDLLPDPRRFAAEAGRDDVPIDDAGGRVDLDAGALAMGHAVAAAPHKGLLPDR